jgi:hypothetical protein
VKAAEDVRATLRAAQEAHSRARLHAATAAHVRGEAVVQARAEGLTLREIGEELGGLTTGRVQQIIDAHGRAASGPASRS